MRKIDFEGQLKVLKENKHYRFSDLFHRWGVRWNFDRNYILRKDEYKNSILRKYLEQKTKEIDYKTLNKIVKEYSCKKNLKLPKASELVIHLRCGDYFDKKEGNCWQKALNQENVLYKLLDQNFPQFQNNGIEKITIVTALHFGANELNNRYFYSDEIYNENLKFLKNVESKINSLGYELNLVSNNDFDLDFCYMANSNYFIKSTSNVSDIIEKCLRENTIVYK